MKLRDENENYFQFHHNKNRDELLNLTHIE